jgi:hypothetical protein
MSKAIFIVFGMFMLWLFHLLDLPCLEALSWQFFPLIDFEYYIKLTKEAGLLVFSKASGQCVSFSGGVFNEPHLSQSVCQ